MRARIRATFALAVAVAMAALPAAPVAAQNAPAASQAPAPPAPMVTGAADRELRLSLEEAVQKALESNQDIAVAKFDPQLSEQSVFSARGYYDPQVYSTLYHQSTDAKGTNAFSGGTTVNTKTDVWNFGTFLPVATGGSVQLDFSNSKRDTNNAFSTYNPVFSSGLTLTVKQPLLRNFKIDQPRYALRLAKKNREISDVQFRQTIIGTVAQVKDYYYQLIYYIDALGAAQKSLQLAQRLLEENEIRVKVGTMAPLDVVQAQSEVASREEAVILAENALYNAEDNLKRQIFPENDPVMWHTRVIPTDRPTAEPTPVDVDAAIKNALENRTDVVAARKGLERNDLALQYYRNQILPDVNLFGNYGGSGAGGTQLVRESLGGPVVSTIPGGYGDAVSEVFGRDYPTWQVGVNLAYAIPNRSAKAARASARISKEQALASFRRLEMAVAAEVRTAARGVESGFKRVQSTKAARVLAAQRLDAEEKKFAAGMSTNYFVTQAQRDLATAEVAELQAIADYRRSVINFQRVQEAGLSGSGAVAALSSGGSAQGSAAVRSSAAASSTQ
ncbi:MAG: TolC family protein [Vicinamibacteria bacterium]